MKRLPLILIGFLLVSLSLFFGMFTSAEASSQGGKPVTTPFPTQKVKGTPVPTPIPSPTTPPVPCTDADPHKCIQRYDGPQTCIACHQGEAQSMLGSEHMQWAGKWKEVNTYCTAPEPADFACRSCHVSTGKVTNLTVNDIDCLVCHNDTYQRALGPQTNIVSVTDWQGNIKTFKFPIKVNGDYQFQPRFDLMPAGTTMVSLAQNVHLPTKASCLRCHAKAGGSDGAKRGDIYMNLKSPALTVTEDVHMSPAGADLTCQACHKPQNHLIPGKGIDLRVNEGGSMACSDCHSDTPHGDDRLDTHASRVACQTCHIPTFGKNTSTELSRDWTHPVWNPSGCNGQGAWVGEEVRGSNVIPQYKFWNGQSQVYSLKDPIQPDADGSYTLSRALGSIQDGKLYPIKVHTSYQPRENTTGRMVQYDVLWNFMTGKFEEAAQRGLTFMGLGGKPYAWVNVRAEQLITHGVEPSQNALSCTACHQARTQMDLRTLGYTLKGPQSQVCTQCHGSEDMPSFNSLHNKHVSDEGYDCSLCHTFTRPERGLKTRK